MISTCIYLILDLMGEIDDSLELLSSLRGSRLDKVANFNRHRTIFVTLLYLDLNFFVGGIR